MDDKKKILIIESAKGLSRCYEYLLGEKFECTCCFTGMEAKKVIERGKRFDVVIMAIVLPIEDQSLSLEDCYETGIRLMALMLERGTCRRFYVISTRLKNGSEISAMCEGKAVLRFEHALDIEPEEFAGNVVRLLSEAITCLDNEATQ